MAQAELDPKDRELLERLARRIVELRLETPALLTIETARPLSVVAGQAMLFFDPVLRTIFGSGSDAMYRVLADESGIDRLIERLEEIDEEVGCDA